MYKPGEETAYLTDIKATVEFLHEFADGLEKAVALDIEENGEKGRPVFEIFVEGGERQDEMLLHMRRFNSVIVSDYAAFREEKKKAEEEMAANNPLSMIMQQAAASMVSEDGPPPVGVPYPAPEKSGNEQ